MNVLPSAPPQLYPMQELTQLNAEDFRLKKINDLLKELSDEVEHYRTSGKEVQTEPLHGTRLSGWPWLTLSWALLWGLGYSLDRVRYCCQPRPCWRCHPLWAGSVGFAAASKRLERKVTKHEKIYTLAQAKRNSVNELVSQALADKTDQ